MREAGVTTQLDTAWCEGMSGDGDLLLWATGAQAHDWQVDPSRRGGLVTGAQGFIRVDAQLRSVSHPDVFAAGDCTESPELVVA